MTWSATLEVDKVTYEYDEVEVTASAYEWQVFDIEVPAGHMPDGTAVPAQTLQRPRINSNTEGAISCVELKVTFDSGATRLKVGDEITVSGHFQG